MTTLAQLKSQVASLLADPNAKTFSDTDIAYFINAGISEVSRIAPLRFTESIALNPNQLEYPVRAGVSNLIANPSFEVGDSTVLDADLSVTTGTAPALLAGWSVSTTMTINFLRSTLAKTGVRVLRIKHANAEASNNLYQDVPVNPGTTYILSGWHWKDVTGGAVNTISANALDTNKNVLASNVITHTATASQPQYMSGTYTTPTDGSVVYIRVLLTAASGAVGTEYFDFEDISLVDASDSNLTASNAVGDVELRSVELWQVADGTNPAHMVTRINPRSGEYKNHFEAGWDLWAGNLRIPYRIMAALDTSVYYVRVDGYSPYAKLTADSQVTDLSAELENAVIAYCHVLGLEKLSMSRDLFTQWQTAMNASDVSPASLLAALNTARDEWRRMKHSLTVLREAP